MSDTLIRGMETPTSCGNCFFDIHCDNWRLRNWGAPPPDDCPLVPVPPHGRLGDLDALKVKAIERSEKCGVCVNVLDKVITAYDIDTAPTIIPAEEGE
jgi:hypothetical protein